MCDQHRLRSAYAYAQSDQSLCSSLEYFMSVKLLTEHPLEFLSLKRGCTRSSEWTLVKMSNCWKSHATAQLLFNHIFFKKVPLLVGNSDDSNRDYKKYAESNLHCFLEAKSWKSLLNNIEACHTSSMFWFFDFFKERWVTWMTDYLSYLLLTVVEYFKFTFKHTFSKIN